MSTQSILKEFDEKFVYWVVLGSTLNDGSERRWKKEGQQPQEIISFLEQAIKDAKEEERKKFIKNEIKILKQKIKDLPELIGGIDSENYELWTMVLKYYQSSLKED